MKDFLKAMTLSPFLCLEIKTSRKRRALFYHLCSPFSVFINWLDERILNNLLDLVFFFIKIYEDHNFVSKNAFIKNGTRNLFL